MTDRSFETVISWVDSLGSPGYMIFDAVETIQHRKTVELTESPVDNGAPIADHAFLNPDVVTITGMVTNTPLPSNPAVGETHDLMGRSFMAPTNIVFYIPEPPPIAPIFTPGGLTSAAVGGIERLLGKEYQNNVAGVWVNTSDETKDRVAQAFNRLAFMQSEFSRCFISTKVTSYENMILTSMIVPEEFSSGDMKKFSLEFRQIITATTLTVEAPEPAEVRGTPPQQGSKQTETPNNVPDKVDKVKKVSRLKASLDWAVDKISP